MSGDSGPRSHPDSREANGRVPREEEAHVHVLLSRESNGRLLADHLADPYVVHTALSDLTSDGDLCLFDERALRRNRSTLEEVKDAAAPVFFPFLLVAHEPPVRLQSATLELADEVVRTPIDVRELRRRVASLLHTRRLSLEVSGRRHLGKLTTVLAHDLRNPLNVAVGNLEFAREERTGADARLERVADALDRMEALVDDALALAEQGAAPPTLEPTSLGRAATRAWTRTLVGNAEFELACDEVTVVADGERLERLFSNLYRNAWEHNEGAVTVTVGATADGFYVADDGDGIPPADRQAVLDAGYTTREAGTGLGLAIVRHVAATHGWSLTVTEGESGGARFEFSAVRTVDGAATGGEDR